LSLSYETDVILFMGRSFKVFVELGSDRAGLKNTEPVVSIVNNVRYICHFCVFIVKASRLRIDSN